MKKLLLITLGVLAVTLILFLFFGKIKQAEKPVSQVSKKIKAGNSLEYLKNLSLINDPELNSFTAKTLTGLLGKDIDSIEREKAVYILNRLDSKTSISPEAEEIILNYSKYTHAAILEALDKKDRARAIWETKFPAEFVQSLYLNDKYKESLSFLKTNRQKLNFRMANQMLSISLLTQNNNLVQDSIRIADSLSNSSEWKMKKTLLNFISGDLSQSAIELSQMNLSGNPDLTALAVAHNARIYLAYCRLNLNGLKSEYRDLIAHAQRDKDIIFNQSGKSRLFSLFISQKKIEKEIAFYKILTGKKSVNKLTESLIENEHLTDVNYITKFILFRCALKARRLDIAAACNVHMSKKSDLIEGMHSGFLLSPQFIVSTAQHLHIQGRSLDALGLIEWLHKKYVTAASLQLFRTISGKSAEFNKNFKIPAELQQFSETQVAQGKNQLIDIKQRISWAKKCDFSKSDEVREYILFLRKSGQIEKIMATLEKRLKIQPDDSFCLLQKWFTLKDKISLAETQKLLSPLLKKNSANAFYIIALQAYKEKQYSETLKNCRKIILSKGLLKPVLSLKARTIIEIYRSAPLTSNKLLIQKVYKQISRIQNPDLEMIKVTGCLAFICKDREKLSECISLLNNKDQDFSTDLKLITNKSMPGEKQRASSEEQSKKMIEILNQIKQCNQENVIKTLNSVNFNIDELSKIAQLLFRCKMYASASICFNRILQKNRTPVSENNAIFAQLKSGNYDKKSLSQRAVDNFKYLPSKITLNTLCEVLSKSGQTELCISIMEENRQKLDSKLLFKLAEMYKSIEKADNARLSLTESILKADFNTKDETKAAIEWLEKLNY